MDRKELAWAAGFFDGEGHVFGHPKGWRGRPSRDIGMAVGQVHPAVIERFRSALGLGRIAVSTTSKGRPWWEFHTESFEGVQAAIAMLWTWLGEVKRDQARAALAAYAAVPVGGGWSHTEATRAHLRARWTPERRAAASAAWTPERRAALGVKVRAAHARRKGEFRES